ncbi:MAG: hypothetical protein GY761_10020 [Hyphomicrobiales bacterium]|nr:hypothetical protein [Hyphomicrobiales bacterium]
MLQGRLLTTLTNRGPVPRVKINPLDSTARGIEDDEWVSIFSPVGEFEMRALIRLDVVQVVHGWEAANVNEQVPDQYLDPFSGFPGQNSHPRVANLARYAASHCDLLLGE